MTGAVTPKLKIWKLDSSNQRNGGRHHPSNDKAITKFVTKEPKDKKGKLDTEKDEGRWMTRKLKEEEVEEDDIVLSIKRIRSILRSGEGRLQHLHRFIERILACPQTTTILELPCVVRRRSRRG